MPDDKEHGKHNRLGQTLELVEVIDKFVNDFGRLWTQRAGCSKCGRLRFSPYFGTWSPFWSASMT